MKLFLYVDETIWAEPGAGFLLLAMVAIPAGFVDQVADRVVRLEAISGRHERKWCNTLEKRKVAFLENLNAVLEGSCPVYWRAYARIADQIEQTVEFVADAASQLVSDALCYIAVDGFNDPECHRLRAALRRRRVRFKRVVGGRDQSEPLLRLTDAMAGYQGDRRKEKAYALRIWPRVTPLFREL